MSFAGLAAASLRIQKAVVSLVSARLADDMRGVAAYVRAFAVHWPPGQAFPSRLHDEAVPGTFPYLQLGAFSASFDGSAALPMYDIEMDIVAVSSPVMGRVQALVLAACVESALDISDEAYDSRYSTGALSIPGTGITLPSLHIADSMISRLDVAEVEIAGQLLYTATLSYVLTVQGNAQKT